MGERNWGQFPDVHKIAVLRANAIGDLMFALPAFAALRSAYPDAEIVLLGQPWHAGFLARRPGPIDRVLVVPRVPGVREERGQEGAADEPAVIEQFLASLRAERFDLAIQMHGGGRNSNPFLLQANARHTAGLKTPDAPPLERWTPYIYFQNEIHRCMEVVSLVGASAVDWQPRLAVTGADLKESCALVPEREAPLAVIHPGVGDGRRRWPAEKFAATGDALAAAGAQVLVTGIPEERSLVETVLHTMRAPAENLCGKISLGGMAGLLSRCAVVVGNDSGMVHLAEAVGASTVAVYWCGNMITAGPLTRAHHRPHISWRLACIICGRNCIYDNCEHHETFVADVTVEEVTASALELLAWAQQPGVPAGSYL